MTNMDDQVAKHIKAMIQRIRQKPTEDQAESPKPDTLNQVVKILKRQDDPYGLMHLAPSSWWDAGPKT